MDRDELVQMIEDAEGQLDDVKYYLQKAKNAVVNGIGLDDSLIDEDYTAASNAASKADIAADDLSDMVSDLYDAVARLDVIDEVP